MQFLLCCEFYHPSVGGVQEVMRQIAERMVRHGHQVTVATSTLEAGMVDEWNGVKIEHFAVSGNEIRGMTGEVERYRDFVRNFPADAILIKAAQQWTFDALFPVLDDITARKLFVPCGFPALFNPAFQDYFKRMPEILRKFDALIFYSRSYRDIDFCRAQGLEKLFFLSNGASETEFASTEPTPGFRKRLGISEDSFLFSTVGTMTGAKGHRELGEAFVRMNNQGRPVTLVLNGNPNVAPSVEATITVPLSAQCMNKQLLVTNLPRPEVVDLFKASDLFVFASNIEYSPLVLFEAAAAGTPFLSVPVGNSEEIAAITGGGIICVAPKDAYGYTRVDPAAFAPAMARAMNSPDLLAQLGARGRKNWEEKFTWDKIATQYEALMTGALTPSA